jgi:ankyrin repeat protein
MFSFIKKIFKRTLHKACDNGNIEAVKMFLADGADVNAKDDAYGGLTPLYYAANKEVAELLIANGADVNAKDDGGVTPLHGAVTLGHKEIAELLIAKGADVNAKDKYGYTPLDKAINPFYNKTEIANLLHKHGGKHGTIHSAVGGGDVEAVKEFLADGADVHAKDDAYGGFTPLHIAANKEVAELLIANGADVNAKDDGGVTPLHGAATLGHKEIAELLIAKGADVNAKTNDGYTPLDRAILNDHTEIADILRKHGGKTGEELKAEGK